MKKFIQGKLKRLAEWYLGPPSKTPSVKCRKCQRKVKVWRGYADGTVECVRCASGLHGEES